MHHGTDFWTRMSTRGPDRIVVDGIEVRPGSRVRLRPRRGGEALDAVLDGRLAVIHAIERDQGDGIHIAVTVDDDPGRDLGAARMPGHRFFFTVDEIEPLGTTAPAPDGRVLVAGIGNVFLGDDGFGVAVAGRLARRALPSGVEVVDFGTRGMELAYALQDDYHAVVFIDAARRGEEPGTLYVIEPEIDANDDVPTNAHGLTPSKALALARAMGRVPARVLVVGCEPHRFVGDGPGTGLVELSRPVAAAVARAVPLVESLVDDLLERSG
ncbi:MAG: hydrogenase maturation protease [Gemmatimonadota bacterium]